MYVSSCQVVSPQIAILTSSSSFCILTSPLSRLLSKIQFAVHNYSSGALHVKHDKGFAVVIQWSNLSSGKIAASEEEFPSLQKKEKDSNERNVRGELLGSRGPVRLLICVGESALGAADSCSCQIWTLGRLLMSGSSSGQSEQKSGHIQSAHTLVLNANKHSEQGSKCVVR